MRPLNTQGQPYYNPQTQGGLVTKSIKTEDTWIFPRRESRMDIVSVLRTGEDNNRRDGEKRRSESWGEGRQGAGKSSGRRNCSWGVMYEEKIKESKKVLPQFWSRSCKLPL